MDPDKNIEPPVFEEDEEEVAHILRDLRYPDRLTQTAAKWLSSCLYQREYKRDFQRPPYQILKVVFSDILASLKVESSEFAEILQARFWDGYSVKEIIAGPKSSWSERSFFLQQKKAIRLFAFLLLEKEKACSQDAAKLSETAAETKNTPVLLQETRESSWPAILFSLVGLIGLSAVLLHFIFPSFPKQTATVSPSPIATAISPVPAAITTEQNMQAPQELTATPPPNICGEVNRITAPQVSRFVRSQGVSDFTVDNTASGVISDRVRALAISPEGLWIGYFENGKQQGGVGQYDKVTWGSCSINQSVQNKNVNALAVDGAGHLWVGFEKDGVGYYDGAEWHYYTTENGLPSNEVFAITIDEQNIVWVGTWEGIARYDGQWSTPYTVYNETLYNNHVHAIAFDQEKNIWVGHVRDGVSEYHLSDGKWIAYRAGASGLSGDLIRSIVIRRRTDKDPELIWFATADGGVSRLENGVWSAYNTENGLPSNEVMGLAVDRYNRVWAATSGGVVYFDGQTWILYNTVNTLSIAIGPSCPDKKCIFDDDVVWTGTKEMGLTHSRLPLPEPVLDVKSVCFVTSEREEVCPELSPLTITNAPVITVTYPITLSPGDNLRFEVTLSTRSPYELKEGRGDFLSNTDKDDFNLFKAWPVIAVKGTIEPGQPYLFTDFDNPFEAPVPEGNVAQYVSSWRVWMHTRYVGPIIRMEFTVAKK